MKTVTDHKIQATCGLTSLCPYPLLSVFSCPLFCFLSPLYPFNVMLLSPASFVPSSISSPFFGSCIVTHCWSILFASYRFHLINLSISCSSRTLITGALPESTLDIRILVCFTLLIVQVDSDPVKHMLNFKWLSSPIKVVYIPVKVLGFFRTLEIPWWLQLSSMWPWFI